MPTRHRNSGQVAGRAGTPASGGCGPAVSTFTVTVCRACAARWLAGRGDLQGAQRAMRALAEPREAAREVAEMAAHARDRKDAPTLRQLLRAPALRRQLTLGVLPCMQQHHWSCTRC